MYLQWNRNECFVLCIVGVCSMKNKQEKEGSEGEGTGEEEEEEEEEPGGEDRTRELKNPDEKASTQNSANYERRKNRDTNITKGET